MKQPAAGNIPSPAGCVEGLLMPRDAVIARRVDGLSTQECQARFSRASLRRPAGLQGNPPPHGKLFWLNHRYRLPCQPGNCRCSFLSLIRTCVSNHERTLMPDWKLGVVPIRNVQQRNRLPLHVPGSRGINSPGSVHSESCSPIGSRLLDNVRNLSHHRGGLRFTGASHEFFGSVQCRESSHWLMA